MLKPKIFKSYIHYDKTLLTDLDRLLSLSEADVNEIVASWERTRLANQRIYIENCKKHDQMVKKLEQTFKDVWGYENPRKERWFKRFSDRPYEIRRSVPSYPEIHYIDKTLSCGLRFIWKDVHIHLKPLWKKLQTEYAKFRAFREQLKNGTHVQQFHRIMAIENEDERIRELVRLGKGGANKEINKIKL